MGEQELRAALRDKARERISTLWQEAEAAVAARRARQAAERQAERDTLAKRMAVTLADERRKVLFAADMAARQQQLAALAGLDGRLHTLALEQLAAASGELRRRQWQAMAGELPAMAWGQVNVHPADAGLARATFPGAEVAGDAALTGGVVAESADGRIVVDNSLARRLARAWPDVLTAVLAAVREELDRDAASPAATG